MMSWVGYLLKESKLFILFAENSQILLKISVSKEPTELIVQLNSSLRHIIVTLVSCHYSQDPIIQTIWNEKIVAPYNAVPQIRPVYDGEKVFIDWKSGLEPAIFVRYSTPAGDPLIHVASNPVFMPNYPGKYFF